MSYHEQSYDYDSRQAPPAPGGVDPYERDEDFVRGDGPGAPPRRRRSVLSRLLRLVIFLLVLVAIMAGGVYAAIHYRFIDPARLGLNGVLGWLQQGGPKPTAPVTKADVIFDGDSALLTTAPGNTVETDPSESIAWLRTTVRSASAAGATDGVSVVIPKELLPRLEGRRVRVTITAKSGAEGGTIPFAAAYSAGPKGNSNWIVFVPEKDFSHHSFSFMVPIGDMAGSDDHRIAIWSDIEGRGIPLGLRSITLEPD